MKKIISTIVLSLMSFGAIAGPVYVQGGISGNGDNCNAGSVAIGYKITKGFGPQLRGVGFDGDSCTDRDGIIAIDIRGDQRISGNFIANYSVGVEHVNSEDNVVFGVGVGYGLAKTAIVGFDVYNTYDENDSSDTFYGGSFTYMF